MDQYLYHHGILGQKWGVRRYQNKDGSLTKAGQKRYSGSKVRLENMTEEVRSQYTRNRITKDGSLSNAVKRETKAVQAAEYALKGKKWLSQFTLASIGIAGTSAGILTGNPLLVGASLAGTGTSIPISKKILDTKYKDLVRNAEANKAQMAMYDYKRGK